MSNTLIAFFLALGAGGWLYNYFMRHTGGLTKNALIASFAVAFIVFLFALGIMSLIPR